MGVSYEDFPEDFHKVGDWEKIFSGIMDLAWIPGSQDNYTHWEFLHCRATPSKPIINIMEIKYFEVVGIYVPERIF